MVPFMNKTEADKIKRYPTTDINYFCLGIANNQHIFKIVFKDNSEYSFRVLKRDMNELRDLLLDLYPPCDYT